MIIFSFIFIYENDFSLKKIIKFIAIYLIIPFLIFTISINFYANQKYEFIKKYIEKEKISKLEKSMKIDKLEKRIILRKFSDFSSGRFEDWKNIYNEFSNKNIFFGYGSQADRYLINQSASNGLIYALISSGIFGFIFFILFSLIVLKKISIYIINFKQTDYINYFFSLLILSIFLRSLLETSYSVYGIDFMIAITAICFINNFKTKN